MVKKESKNKQDNKAIKKSIKWFLILLVIFFIVYFATPKIIKEIKTVEYGNLTFTKTKFQDIPVYYYWYNLVSSSGEISRYNLYLRENPQENPVLVTGEIEYPKAGSKIYVSLNDSSVSKECTNLNREMLTLGIFLKGNMYDFKLVYPDNETATKNSGIIANCQNRPKNMVIEIAQTNRTIIERVNENCYKLEFNTCKDLLYVIEKFEVQTLIDAKNRSLYG